MPQQFFVYIMTNKTNNVLYTGVTNDLKRRVYEHKEIPSRSFAWRYRTTRLVYYEVLSDSYNAIAREKQIKSGSRQKKIDLIESVNPQWRDLYNEI